MECPKGNGITPTKRIRILLLTYITLKLLVMRKIAFYLLSMMLFNSLLWSCKDDVPISSSEQPETQLNEKELICFPKSELNSSSRSNSNDWEKWEKVALPSGDSVHTPWNPMLAGTDIPIEIRQDIKKENGWELIAHTMKGYGEKGMNYLLFHNKYTGVLKVFYYLEQGTGQLQNTGIWNLHFEAPQALLNFTTDFAKPASVKGDNDFYVGNITNNKSNGFSLGWNCFQVELSYDPNFKSIPLQIIPYNMSVSDIKFDGTFESSTTGSIIQTYKTNIFDNQIKAVAGYAGKRAEDWVKKAVEDKVIKLFKKDIKDIIINGAGSIATSGVSSLLHCFLGGFDKENNTIQSVQLRTNGTYTMSGQLTKVESGIIMPLSINLSTEKVGKLGVWYLEDEPIFELSPIAHRDVDNNETEEAVLKNYYFENWLLKYKATMNPDLASQVKSCTFNYTLYERSTCNHDNAFSYPNHAPGHIISRTFPQENQLYDDIYRISNIPLTIRVGAVPNPPLSVYTIDAPSGEHGAVGNIFMRKFHVASISMTLTIDINGKENTIVSSHMFDIDKYQWSPWEDKDRSYWPFKNN
jgi:hypothetical protein